jgi:2-phospho-L-lactate guanylyltransferase
MIGWTAILPLKLSADRKSRLGPAMSLEDRRALGDRMALHVITQLRAVKAINAIIMLSPRPVPDWPVHHLLDQGRGLNAELDAVAAGFVTPLLVIHGDLPIVRADDIEALIDAAEGPGRAIAPDRHGQGTNALALTRLPPGFNYAFGPDSFALHRQRLGSTLAIVNRDGLACDVDTQDDLEQVHALNFKP